MWSQPLVPSMPTVIMFPCSHDSLIGHLTCRLLPALQPRGRQSCSSRCSCSSGRVRSVDAGFVLLAEFLLCSLQEKLLEYCDECLAEFDIHESIHRALLAQKCAPADICVYLHITALQSVQASYWPLACDRSPRKEPLSCVVVRPGMSVTMPDNG